MSECRIEDKSPAYIAFASLRDVDKAIKDSNYVPPFYRIALIGLDTISDILESRNQVYEGLEAMAICGNTYYFSIETNTPSDSCYIIKGELIDSTILLNTQLFLAIAKPKDENGKHIYNTGFESMEIKDGNVYAFFEYNYFNNGNYVVMADLSLDAASLQRIPIEKIPFRITDVSWDKKANCYWGINYFYQGGGGDTIYRVPENDPNYSFMHAPYVTSSDAFKGNKDSLQKAYHSYAKANIRSYCRIVQIKEKDNRFTFKSFADLPFQYWAYNWEGLARYKKGFFLMNDKYTPKRPYFSDLLFLEK
ncbi:MAG: hypothetical protein DI598_17120 [Pseudopedobacter saltans]|uniref:Uncharacterized protein n=1 Tax=Pseudopedobacter saltans TaxID=151895 RepID=A0A2W5EIB1_9SPHI|nr:MAG: hypothetical protein DI598_17120 [Pseudopedobacter saltans]